MDHEDSFQLSPFDMDQFDQEPEPLLSQARDPVQLFLKLGEIMGEVKNGRGSMLKSGRYSPKDGGRSIRISNMGQLAEKGDNPQKFLRGDHSGFLESKDRSG